MTAKLVVDRLISDLELRCDEFTCNELVLKDTTNGFSYWVGNCFFDAGIHEPYEMGFGVIHGWRFHRALRKWKAWANLNSIGP